MEYFENLSEEILSVDSEPKRIEILSEPFPVFTRFGYQVAFRVWLKKKKREAVLIAGASSLSKGIENLKDIWECDSYTGMEFWIQKESDDRRAKYLVSD